MRIIQVALFFICYWGIPKFFGRLGTFKTQNGWQPYGELVFFQDSQKLKVARSRNQDWIMEVQAARFPLRMTGTLQHNQRQTLLTGAVKAQHAYGYINLQQEMSVPDGFLQKSMMDMNAYGLSAVLERLPSGKLTPFLAIRIEDQELLRFPFPEVQKDPSKDIPEADIFLEISEADVWARMESQHYGEFDVSWQKAAGFVSSPWFSVHPLRYRFHLNFEGFDGQKQNVSVDVETTIQKSWTLRGSLGYGPEASNRIELQKVLGDRRIQAWVSRRHQKNRFGIDIL